MSSKSKITISITILLTLLFIPTALAFNQKDSSDAKTTEAELQIEQEKKFAAIRTLDENIRTPKEVIDIENKKIETTPSLAEVSKEQEGTPKQIPISTSTPSPLKQQPTSQPKITTRQPNSTAQTATYDIKYIQKRICEVFGSQCQNALSIAKSESGYKLTVVSSTNDYGLFQINCPSHASKVGGDCTKFFDLETNLRVAKQIYDASGWRPWTTCKIYNICNA